MSPRKEVSWVNRLPKGKLVEIAEDQQINTKGTYTQLKKRLITHIKELEPSIIEQIKRLAEIRTNQCSPEKITIESEEQSETDESEDDEEEVCKPTKKISDIAIIEHVRKWSFRYDGGKDVIDFLERTEEQADIYQIERDRLLRTLPELLRGRALEWWRNNRNTWNTWAEFTVKIRQYFLPPQYKKALDEEIRMCTQKVQEDFKTYSERLRTLLRRRKSKPEKQLEIIYDNLQPDYKLYIRRRDFESLETLMEISFEYEQIKRSTGKQARNQFLHGIAEQTEPAKYLIGFSTRSCWNCGQNGHTRFECRNRQVLFCSRCGKLNTKTMDCHPLNANSSTTPQGNRYSRNTPPCQ